jgi:hypothetical protein
MTVTFIMANISEEEFDLMESEERMKAAMKKLGVSIAGEVRQEVAILSSQLDMIRNHLASVAQPDPDKRKLMATQEEIKRRLVELQQPAPAAPAIDIQPIIAAMQEELAALKKQNEKPTSFRVDRNRYTGRIEQVIPEY